MRGSNTWVAGFAVAEDADDTGRCSQERCIGSDSEIKSSTFLNENVIFGK